MYFFKNTRFRFIHKLNSIYFSYSNSVKEDQAMVEKQIHHQLDGQSNKIKLKVLKKVG